MDEDLRSLERRASQGDYEAAQRVEAIRERCQAPVLWRLKITRAIPVVTTLRAAPEEVPAPPVVEAPRPFTHDRWEQVVRLQQRELEARRTQHPPMRREAPTLQVEPDSRRPRYRRQLPSVRTLTDLAEISARTALIGSEFVSVWEDGFEYQLDAERSLWVPTTTDTAPLAGAARTAVVRAYGEGHARQIVSHDGEFTAWLFPERSTCQRLDEAGECEILVGSLYSPPEHRRPGVLD